jgi:hypothetical protein
MSRILSMSVLVLISISIIGCGKPIETKIIGKWQINVDRSIEMAKTLPMVKPADHERITKMIQHAVDMIQMEITESEFKAILSTETNAQTYKVISTDEDAKTVTILVTYPDAKTETYLCTVIDNAYIKLFSSGSDDINGFVWEPAKQSSVK